MAMPPTARPRAPSQAWRDDPEARASWHAYQLIGDVLRSEDLAAEPAADEAFLVALRARLADEPVVLAPQARVERRAGAPMPAAVNASTAAIRSRARWQGPLTMAAGFLVMLGGLSVVGPFRHGADPQRGLDARPRGPALASTRPGQQRRHRGHLRAVAGRRARPRPTSSRPTWRRTASRR